MFMKVSRLAVAVFCSALGAAFAGSSHAQQKPNPTFELAMCNLSDFQGVFVALRHKQNAQKWAVDGWYAIPDGGCTFIGTFLRDTIYYFGESNDGAVWSAADTDKTAAAECIDLEKTFKRASGGSCAEGQLTARFRLITVPANLSRLTFTLTGRR
jgi:uncharacterized membrane protein